MRIVVMLAMALATYPVAAIAQSGTEITYQGELHDGGSPANGNYNLEFSLWNAANGGSQIGSTVTINNQPVSDGRFTVELDFGAAAFDNSDRWLEIDVNGTTLIPRQPVTRAPYAIQTRGLYTNDSETFTGVGRESGVTTREYFGVNAPVNSGYGGMYITTDSESAWPFYGYAAGGTGDAWHYLDGSTGTWHLYNNGNRLSVGDNGFVGIGAEDPQAFLHVEPSVDFEHLIDVEDFDGETIFKVNWAGGTEIGPRDSICALNVGAASSGGEHIALWWLDTSSGVSKQRIYSNKIVFPDTGPVLVGRSNTITPAEQFGVHASVLADEYGGMYVSTFDEDAWPFYGYAAGETADMWTYYDGGTGDWIVYNNGNRLTVESNGEVGIGTVSPAFLLHCNGSAGKPGGGSWSNSSDRRLKKNINDLDGSLDKLMKLRGVTFEYVDPKAINELAGERIGVVAQEVEKVFPDWVDERKDGYKAVTFRGFEALTVEALRELREEKDKEIDQLQTENDELRERLEALEAMMESFAAQAQGE